MALVVFLRGINVGGHRSFRPTLLAQQLQHLGTVNFGATGTFVIRRPISRTQLRAEIKRRLPFEAEIVICEGREILRLVFRNPFADVAMRADEVRFVSVLSKRQRSASSAPSLPLTLPADGEWLLKILGREDRFVFGVYRRHMRVISYLGELDRLFGVPATTRGWKTFTAIAGVLSPEGT